MTFIPNANYDPATGSDFTQEIEKANDIITPEDRPGTSLANTTYPEYFQHHKLKTFTTDLIVDPGTSGTITVNLYRTNETGVAVGAVGQWINVSAAAGWPVTGLVVNAGAAIADSIVLPTQMIGAELIKVELVVAGGTGDGSYQLLKNSSGV
jgi:hypothetical protein